MTIFGQIIIIYFSQVMDHLIKHSASGDSSFFNQSITLLGMGGRDTNLSLEKQKKAGFCKEKLFQYDTENLSDEKLMLELMMQMQTFETEITDLCKDISPDKTYSPKIVQARTVAKSIYQKFTEFGLLNIKWSDKDPVSVMLFCSGMYLAAKETTMKNGWLHKIEAHPKGGNGTELNRLRDNLLKNIIFYCARSLEAMNSEHPFYYERRLEELQIRMMLLLLANEKLSNDPRFESSLKIPLEFSLLGSANLLGSWHPSEGSLKGYMIKALTSIKCIPPHARTIVVWASQEVNKNMQGFPGYIDFSKAINLFSPVLAEHETINILLDLTEKPIKENLYGIFTSTSPALIKNLHKTTEPLKDIVLPSPADQKSDLTEVKLP